MGQERPSRDVRGEASAVDSWGRHPGFEELLLLDGNTALANAYLDPGRLLPFLVELITGDSECDGKHGDKPNLN
jgi:hypothetical protein